MIRIYYLFILLLVLLFLGCSNYDYKVTDLDQKEIEFKELPSKVKSFYLDPNKHVKDESGFIRFVCLSENCNYDLETIETWYGPWVSYNRLIDKENKISYRIDQGTPYPYVLFNQELYIAKKYNVLTTVKDFSSLVFVRYSLRE